MQLFSSLICAAAFVVCATLAAETPKPSTTSTLPDNYAGTPTKAEKNWIENKDPKVNELSVDDACFPIAQSIWLANEKCGFAFAGCQTYRNWVADETKVNDPKAASSKAHLAKCELAVKDTEAMKQPSFYNFDKEVNEASNYDTLKKASCHHYCRVYRKTVLDIVNNKANAECLKQVHRHRQMRSLKVSFNTGTIKWLKNADAACA